MCAVTVTAISSFNDIYKFYSNSIYYRCYLYLLYVLVRRLTTLSFGCNCCRILHEVSPNKIVTFTNQENIIKHMIEIWTMLADLNVLRVNPQRSEQAIKCRAREVTDSFSAS